MIIRLIKFIILLVVFLHIKCNSNKFPKSNIQDDSSSLSIETNIIPIEVESLWFMQIPSSDSNLIQFNSNENYSFLVPSNWNLKNSSNFIFMASLDTINSNEYVVVLKQNKNKIDNSYEYLNYVLNRMRADTEEVVVRTEQYELNFVDKKSIYMGKFNTVINSIEYLIFTCYFEDEGYIYDISMKRSLNAFNSNELLDFINFLKYFRIDGIQKMNLSNLSSIIKIDPMSAKSKGKN